MTPEQTNLAQEVTTTSPSSPPLSPNSQPPHAPEQPPQQTDKPLSQNDQPTHPFVRQPVSTPRMYMMVLADFGLAFVWLCKYAVATPYFQHSLKAGPFLSHVVWIMGPLSGLIVAPVVGVLSDRCTSSFGRRRPFILMGTIFCIIGMNIFANAAALSFGILPIARIVAVLAFGVLDFATNAIMFPSRALFGDLLPPEQQHPVQSAAAVVASMAEICGGVYISSWKDPVTNVSTIFAVASVLLAASCTVSLVTCRETPFVPDDTSEHSDALQTLMEEGRVQSNPDGSDSPPPRSAQTHQEISDENAIGRCDEKTEGRSKDQNVEDSEIENDDLDHADENTLALPVSRPERTDSTNENPYPSDAPDAPDASDAPKKEPSTRKTLQETIRKTITQFPRPLIKVGIVYAFAWFMWFSSLPYYSQWLGVDVLQGDPHAEPSTPAATRYQHGVSVFSVANVAKALLAMLFSFYYPSIIEFVGAVGERMVFGLSFLVFSTVLFSCAYTKNVFVAAAVIAIGSVPFIVTQTIPIAIVVQRYPENLASNLGVMNLFCVVPQLIDTLYTGKVAEVGGESTVLRVASGWGFAAAFTAFCFL